MGASLLTLGLATSCMERDRLITADKLPAAAQAFLAESFPGVDVSFAKAETEWFSTEYKVVMVDGMVVVFDGKGNWTDIDCKYGAEVPARLIPPQIAAYVAKHFPDAETRTRPPRLRGRARQRLRDEVRPRLPAHRSRRLIRESADPLRTPCVAGRRGRPARKPAPADFSSYLLPGRLKVRKMSYICRKRTDRILKLR